MHSSSTYGLIPTICSLSDEDFLEGRIRWADAGEASMTGDETDEVDVSPTSLEELPTNLWEATLDQRGRTYYWNVATRETAWDLPDGAVLSEVKP